MDPAVSLNLYTTIGAFLIGVLVSYVLVAQTYIYYGRFPDDSPKLKALVCGQVCEIIHGLCIGHGLYVYTICDYWHPDRIFGGPSPPSMDTAVLFCVIIATCVQGFYGSQIYTFSGNLYIPILIWIMASLRLPAGFGNLISGLRMASLVDHNRHWLWLSGFGWSISAATDLTIAATLVLYLHQQRKKVDKSSRTAVLVDKLILWTIETGALTSLSSIVALAFHHNEDFIYLAFFTLEATTDGMTCSLNSRETLSEMNEHEISSKFSLPAMSTTPAVSVFFMSSTTRIGEVNSRFPPSLFGRRG
ncbi:hypothetical protein DFH08DRAFT_901798 [Mycena albidolilacea]|uniref:DUF6534 domain-containing protein n=1 Tax=Mycena albidolilacea TaxID=1033008 RepID=A0AAD7EA48_9AGAR|nr:hypothetical protein DFH08DRAFT_901798 [Mycena albidolilacea]